jgi:diadenylate cyclase
MIESLRGSLVNLISALRATDLIDVLLVAFFLFVLLSWMMRSMSQSAVRGIGVLFAILAGVFLSARFLDLYLIGQVTTVLLFAILLAAIVAFQADLRRMFDRTGTWLFSRRSSPASSGTPTVDLLVNAATKFGEMRTGALIAVKGAEPWDHQMQGGIELGGALSLPLLFSLFDDRTPGHDGALLIEGNTVTKFAVHLPLAPVTANVSRYGGTRHAAALGLAEVCDAFIVVVSEERGTISVAHEGAIMELEGASQLRERLGHFWQRHYGETHRFRGRWLNRRSLWTAALSLGVSALMWILFAYSPEVVNRSFDVPIEYRNVPANWRIQEGPNSVRVRLSGPDQAFRLVDPAHLVVTLFLDQPQDGENRLIIDRGHLNLPNQITLDSVDPEVVTVRAWPLTPTLLLVHVPSRGRLPDSLELVSLRADPDSVTVLIPEGSSLSQLVTEPVALDSVVQTGSIKRALVLPDGVLLPDQRIPEVTVHITVRPKAAQEALSSRPQGLPSPQLSEGQSPGTANALGLTTQAHQAALQRHRRNPYRDRARLASAKV